MRRLVAGGGFFVHLATGGGAAFPQAPGVTAFVDVSVIPMDREQILPGHTVVVRGDRIVALGPTARVSVPTDAIRIDGRGKFLMPTLGDMHVHINFDDPPQLKFWVANGVTTVRDMFGNPNALKLRNRQASGELIGPRIYLGGRRPDGCTAVGKPKDPESQIPLTCLTRLKAAGYVMAKFRQEEVTVASFDSMVAAARQLQFPMGGHVSPVVGLERALRAPYVTIEHLTSYFHYVAGVPDTVPFHPGGASRESPDYLAMVRALADTARWMRPDYRLDERRLQAAVAATRQAGTWNVPTLTIRDAYGARCQPMETLTTPQSRISEQSYRADFQLVKALQDGGAGLLLGTDIGSYGFAVHRELELFIHAGLTPYQALVTGTRNVAAYLKTQDSMGTVAVGKIADLMLLERNPLTDIRNTSGPVGVMQAGRWWGHTDLDAWLNELPPGDEHHDYRAMRRQAAEHAGVVVRDQQCRWRP